MNFQKCEFKNKNLLIKNIWKILISRIDTDSHGFLSGLEFRDYMDLATDYTDTYGINYTDYVLAGLVFSANSNPKAGFIIEYCLRPQVQYNWPYLLS